MDLACRSALAPPAEDLPVGPASLVDVLVTIMTTMAMTRRAFLRTAAAAGAALTLPLVPALPTPRVAAACESEGEAEKCPNPDTGLVRPPGPPGFEPWWVQT